MWIVRLLTIHSGISPDLQDEQFKRTPLLALLHRQLVYALPDAAELLLTHMSDSALAIQDIYGNTSLHRAVSQCDVKTVSLLLQRLSPASILQVNSSRDTALHELVGNLRQKISATECSEILVLLIAHNPEIIHMRKILGNTPLHLFTLWSSNIQDITNLLEAGADMNALNDNGEPPYHMNASSRWPEVTQLLLDYGADMHESCQACRLDLANFRDREKMPVVEPEIDKVRSDIDDPSMSGLSGLFE